DWKPAAGVDLLPWLWTEANASRPRGERVRERLKLYAWLFGAPIALSATLAAASGILGRDDYPRWLKVISGLVIAAFWCFVAWRGVLWCRRVGISGALRSFVPRRAQSGRRRS